MGVLLLQFGAVMLGEIDHQQAARPATSTRAASAIAAPGCCA